MNRHLRAHSSGLPSETHAKRAIILLLLAVVVIYSFVALSCSSSKRVMSGSVGATNGVISNSASNPNTNIASDNPSSIEAYEHNESDDGKYLSTDNGEFALFIVDNKNKPFKNTQQIFEIEFDTQSNKLIVNLNIEDKTALVNLVPSLQNLALYFLLEYDDSQLTPIDVVYGDVLGNQSEVLCIAALNKPGQIGVGLSRIGADTRISSSDIIRSNGLSFSVSFKESPFDSSRSVSTVDDRRRTASPTDVVTTDALDGTYHLDWTERNIGDYDATGEVSIADITPIALNYLRTIEEATNDYELELYQQIDGDGSGDIGISDITPIANNYLVKVNGYDIWRNEDPAEGAAWLVNIANPGLLNPDTASAPRPDLSAMPPERDGLAIRYSYDSSQIQSKYYGKKTKKSPSSLESVFYILAKHEDGLDITPPDVSFGAVFGQESAGSAEVNLLVEISGNVARPFTLAVKWDESMRPQIFENYNANGTDEKIIYNYQSGGMYSPCVTLISSDGYVFAKRLQQVSVSGPEAFLTINPSVGIAPLSVVLDASGSIVGDAPFNRFEWDFEGDGVYDEDSGVNSTIEHTYTLHGNYTPTVKVWDENSAFGIASQPLEVNATAVAELTADPLTGSPPLTVTFDASLSTSPNGSIVEHQWDWDGDLVYDETSGTESIVQHTYNETGVFNANLLITDEIGAQGSASVEISVTNQPPIAKIYADLNRGNIPLTVHFSAAGSNDPNGEIVRYEWDLDGDGSFEYNSGLDQTAVYTYNESGDYNVSVMVTDSDGATDTESILITAIIRPVAVADANPKTGNAPLLVTFTADGSYDPDGVIVQYRWDFDGDGNFDWSSSTTGNTQYLYTTGGLINARLRVYDDDNATATETVVLDINSPPVVTVEADVTVGEPPLLVNFDASKSYDPNGEIVNFEWDFDNDGVFELDTDLDPTSSYEFTDNGSYWVTCRATDDLGGMGTGKIRISINNIPPIAIAGADVTSGDKPLTVNLNADASSDPDGSILKWEWDFEGDGTYDWTSDTGGDVQNVYNERGSFLTTLRVTDNDDDTTTDTIEIHVNDWQPSLFEQSSLDYTSIEIDSNDRPHIAFVSDKFYHAYFDGSNWVLDVITSTAGEGMNASLELNGSDYPFVSYYDMNNLDLKYAYNIGAGWVLTTVDNAGDVGSYSSLVLDSVGRPHISYARVISGQDTTSELKHAYYNGTSWTRETVDSAGLPGFGTSIQVDSNDRSHIAYYAGTNGDLLYALYNGATWTKSTVDSAGMVGWYPSLVLHSSNRRHVSYYDNTNGDLKYARYDGAAWAIEVVDSSNNTGTYGSLVLDSNEIPHISYCYASNNDLRYAVFNGANWDVETVDDDGMDGWFTSIAVGSNNKPHISYCDNGFLGYVYLE